MDRFDVRSDDGTSLAVWPEGDGPPVVLVHGSIADHTTLAPLVDELSRHMATFSMDRRGFGASGDTPPYSIERDFEDVAAVVDAAAATTGGPVALFGHSYGAGCALGAAALTRQAASLVLYEPSLGISYPPGSIEEIEESIAGGDLDRAAVSVLALIGMSEAQIEALRTSRNPDWSTRIASAWTLPREARAEESWTYQPGRFSTVRAPTLLLAGSESPPDLVEATRRGRRGRPRSPDPDARGPRPHGPQGRSGAGRRHHPGLRCTRGPALTGTYFPTSNRPEGYALAGGLDNRLDALLAAGGCDGAVELDPERAHNTSRR